MLLMAKYCAAFFIGVIVSFIVYRTINLVALKIKAKPQKVCEEIPPKRKSKKELLKEALATLAENPDSKKSNKIKLYTSIFILLIFQILIGKFLFALLFAAGAYFGITFYYRKQIQHQVELFENQLIEALGMITNSVRAGQSLQQALENMVKDTKPPISTEFETALRQVKLGTPLNQALLDITERNKSKDLRITITSINLAKETGGNLGEILTRLASTMKERKKIQGKIVALTAQGKVSGIVMGCVPFLLLAVLYIIEPNMMGLLFSTMLGNVMLFLAIIMVALGMFFIQKIVNIDI